MTHLLSMTEPQLQDEFRAMGQPVYRARQVLQWIWVKGVTKFEEMTDLPASLRGALGERLSILTGRAIQRQDADDGVTKLLLEWPDGERIESVLIPAESRRTACLSTQAGCAIGCSFCASGQAGLGRDLTSGEILEQLLHLRQAIGERISHVVLMGVGEPLANYDATVAAIRVIVDAHGAGISPRRVTLSTVGLPAQIRRLADEDLPITLALSVHAPNDALRRQIIPGAKGVRLAELVAAAQDFFDRRGREVTLEYILLAGVNDSTGCADELADVAGQLRCNVNLIRYNPVAGLPFRRPDEESVRAFRDRLLRQGVNVQIRASRGQQTDAACGQLRRGPGAARPA
jgi:23S rRNA (adenine2503-C2)-methyltransferase